MATIVLISCVSQKLPHSAPAGELYTSTLFKLNLQYARLRKPDVIYILSAKYGLLPFDEVVEPYEMTLNTMPVREIKAWSQKVYTQLASVSDVEHDHFIWLAGMKYRQHLIDHLRSNEVPLEGLTIGRQLQFLQQHIAEMSRPMGTICDQLHHLVNRLPRHRFPIDMSAIPKNGIYILFEAGEKGHGVDRIVRVGTHTGKDQMRSRLNQHFVNENKDRSIFRKNIGRALLARDQDPFISDWELDLTTSDAKAQHAEHIDLQKQQDVERQVTMYIQENLSFVVFQVDDKAERLALESKLISTVSGCQTCGPSAKWLGLCSPRDKIRESGLWLVNELYKTPLSSAELSEFANMNGLSVQ